MGDMDAGCVGPHGLGCPPRDHLSPRMRIRIHSLFLFSPSQKVCWRRGQTCRAFHHRSPCSTRRFILLSCILEAHDVVVRNVYVVRTRFALGASLCDLRSPTPAAWQRCGKRASRHRSCLCRGTGIRRCPSTDACARGWSAAGPPVPPDDQLDADDVCRGILHLYVLPFRVVSPRRHHCQLHEQAVFLQAISRTQRDRFCCSGGNDRHP
mmetsp:Transcript_3191/g.6117  ORF Transcript_3191/g.6117 Transcript_3191/m.6117 type:complete len:209 (+) Transcript_3191:454-1080(+)